MVKGLYEGASERPYNPETVWIFESLHMNKSPFPSLLLHFSPSKETR